MQSFVPKWLVFGDRFDSMTIGVCLSQSQRVWVKQASSSQLCCSKVYNLHALSLQCTTSNCCHVHRWWVSSRLSQGTSVCNRSPPSLRISRNEIHTYINTYIYTVHNRLPKGLFSSSLIDDLFNLFFTAASSRAKLNSPKSHLESYRLFVRPFSSFT